MLYDFVTQQGSLTTLATPVGNKEEKVCGIQAPTPSVRLCGLGSWNMRAEALLRGQRGGENFTLTPGQLTKPRVPSRH